MISDARGGHVSPGIYTEEKDVTYSVKSLGITSLGLAGETLYGPAFENIEINSWSDFVDYFGGCSPEKYKGTGLPKYELPYIAKSYLEESKQLNVVRVLGLSGYKAGQAWALCTSSAAQPTVIVRSKVTYSAAEADPCNPSGDEATELVTGLSISPYAASKFDARCSGATDATALSAAAVTLKTAMISAPFYQAQIGFKNTYSAAMKKIKGEGGNNPFILSGTLISAVADSWQEASACVSNVTSAVGTVIKNIATSAYYESYASAITVADNDIKKWKDALILAENLKNQCIDIYNGETISGTAYILPAAGYSLAAAEKLKDTGKFEKDKSGNTYILMEKWEDAFWATNDVDKIIKHKKDNGTFENAVIGEWQKDSSYSIYLPYSYVEEKIKKITDLINACNEYIDAIYDSIAKVEAVKNALGYDANKFAIEANRANGTKETYNVSLNPADSDYIYNVISSDPATGTTPIYIEAVYENSWNGKAITTAISADTKLTDFHSAYRAAQTPWIVSNISRNVNMKQISMKKLFRFITISDGDASNFQVKVSIQNIKPADGTFDVVVRDYNDTDANIVVLEKFSKCNLVEGDANYLGIKIGTSDGGYAAKSKYITVEFADGEDKSSSVPAGFLGYPMPKYNSKAKDEFPLKYNTEYNTDVKAKKQYFGLSDRTGIDEDVFKFKGIDSESSAEYADMWNKTAGFHLDATINASSGMHIMVDGVEVSAFTTVSSAKVGSEEYIPEITANAFMEQTIYADVNLRKFTVCFYGGFDGWDVNRESRTNTDNYKASKYNGKTYEKISDSRLNLPTNAISSDYYAYLAGYRVFANPQDVDINLFATPGINWYDNTLLTEDAIDMIEDSEDGRGGDALYIMAAPSNMDASELAQNFEDLELNSSYACTYAPWIMYYDSSNKRYLNLPVTKDVVRNMAKTDNNSYPWFAPAGIDRGDVNCVKAEFKTTLANEDALYEVGINPVKTFAQDGVKIWGNKTAYQVDSPLNRVNVRRLMLRVKKLVTSAVKSLIFEQYDSTLEKQFKGLVEPILADVKSNRGISDYRVITEVTSETKDQHILPAKILIKPINALEYISLSFVVYPESVEFQD